MWARLILGSLLLLMLGGAWHFKPPHERSLLGAQAADGAALRLLTWNVGYAELEADTRAHSEDLPAIADVILHQDPDAVALQELTGAEQLRALLSLLRGRYRGALAQAGAGDRFEAVLVKDRAAQFAPIAAGDRFAASATFRPRAAGPEVVFVSAHADAFNAARRRRYTEALVAWTRTRPAATLVFVAGDFNFELTARNESNLYTDNLKHDSEAYSYLLRYYRDLARAAGDTAINDRRIDYVFAPLEAGQLHRAEVLRATAVGRMDHWPVLVEVNL